eukprot:6518425-Alexandrium_andersonii.AAC.1
MPRLTRGALVLAGEGRQVDSPPLHDQQMPMEGGRLILVRSTSVSRGLGSTHPRGQLPHDLGNAPPSAFGVIAGPQKPILVALRPQDIEAVKIAALQTSLKRITGLPEAVVDGSLDNLRLNTIQIDRTMTTPSRDRLRCASAEADSDGGVYIKDALTKMQEVPHQTQSMGVAANEVGPSGSRSAMSPAGGC